MPYLSVFSKCLFYAGFLSAFLPPLFPWVGNARRTCIFWTSSLCPVILGGLVDVRTCAAGLRLSRARAIGAVGSIPAYTVCYAELSSTRFRDFWTD
jgi:hypothetical protein